MASHRPCTSRHRLPVRSGRLSSGEVLGEGLDGGLQLGFGLVGQRLLVADRVQNVTGGLVAQFGSSPALELG